MSRSALFTLVAVSGLAACSLSARRDGGNGAVGQVHAAISQVPPATFCVKVVAAGSRTVTKLVDVTPGQTDASVDLDDVAIGEIDFAGFAYGASCAGLTNTSQPNYASALTPAAVQPGQVTTLQLTLLPVGGAHVGINFGDDSDGGVDGGVDGGAVPDLGIPPDLSVPPDFALPPAANGSVTPTQLSFLGQGQTLTAQIVNSGPANVVVALAITGANANVFQLNGGSCNGFLPAGASCSLPITYNGSFLGAYSAQVNIQLNNAQGGASFALVLPLTHN